jgi:hypothetical protein
MEPTLKRLASGYWHLRWNDVRWAQWPGDREPTREDCFTVETWPLVEQWKGMEQP